MKKMAHNKKKEKEPFKDSTPKLCIHNSMNRFNRVSNPISMLILHNARDNVFFCLDQWREAGQWI
jgi:hypothetical protein